MSAYLRLRCLCILMPVLLSSAGCVTHLPDNRANPFGSIGGSADIYIAAPVRGNEQLLSAYFTRFMTEKDAHRFFSRTTRVYAGLHTGIHPEVRLYAEGGYPAGISGLIFPKKNGWVKKKAKIDTLKISYFHSTVADAVLTPSQLHFLFGDSTRESEAFVSRICMPERVQFPPDFLYGEQEAVAITVFVQSPEVFFSAFSGLTDIQLPVTRIVLKLSPYKENYYRFSARFETPTERTAQILKLLIKNSIRADISVQDSYLLVENGILSIPEIIQMLKVV